MRSVETLKEVAPFLHPSPTASAGEAGKRGAVRLGFELDDEGRSILRDLYRAAPLIVQQALYFDEQMPEMPCVYILSAGGPNIDGDRYEQIIDVGKAACAHISTGAATKSAEMQYDCSATTQRFTVDEDGYLEVLPEPVIPCRHTRFVSDTLLRVAPTATIVYAETFTCGRKHSGERFDYDVVSVCNRAERLDGEPLFREKYVITPSRRTPRQIGAMGDYDVYASVVVLTPKEHIDAIYSRAATFIDRDNRTAAGITRLPEECGLIYKVVGSETEPVKRLVRAFCSEVRNEIKGRPLFDEFPWR